MADNKDDKAAAGAAKPEAPAGPKMILGMTIPVLALVAVNLLMMLAGLGYIIFVSLLYTPNPITDEVATQEISKNAAKKAGADGNIHIEPLSALTINLKVISGGKNHFATVTAAVECSNEECIQQVKAYKTKIEDLVQDKISTKSFTELNALETRFRLRHEILEEANTYITEGTITNIYFDEFVIQ